MRYTQSVRISIVIGGAIFLALAQMYVNSIKFSLPHIKADPYIWAGSCQKNLYESNSLSCDCLNIRYKVSSWSMIRYGIHAQRSEGLYRIGNDLVEITKDFSGKCSIKNNYRNAFYQD